MTDEPAFTAALARDPLDATTRLVYADWLDEQGRPVGAALQRVLARPAEDGLRLAFADAIDAEAECCGWDVPQARAELVRVQVELGGILAESQLAPDLCSECGVTRERLFTGTGDHRPDCRTGYLANREVHLLTTAAKQHWDWTGSEHLTYWVKREPQFTGTGPVMRLVGTFVRGMIERVTGSAALWLEHASAIRAAHPIHCVRLTTRAPFVRRDGPDGFGGWQLATRTRWFGRDTVPPGAEVLPCLFAAEWPGIEFEWPPVVSGPMQGGGQWTAPNYHDPAPA